MFGLLITCVIAKLGGNGYANDRFNFVIAYGLMVLFWCLVTFLLYLCDVTTRCQPETMRTLVSFLFLFLI